MPAVKISDLGQIGIVNDLPRFKAPNNAITLGKNIRAYHGRLRSFGGHEVQAIAPIEPFGLFAFTDLNRAWLWIEAGLNRVYVYDGNVHTDITRLVGGDYTLNEETSRWTGGTCSGYGFLCPGLEDAPQIWPQIGITSRLEDMTYDPTAAPGSRTWNDLGYAANAMRNYKCALFALGVARGATGLPQTVQWSDFQTIGNTEPDWVPRTTNSAGEQPLTETTGVVIDGAPLRDDFIVYKEDSAYRVTFTEDADNPFAFSRLPDYVRILNRNCIGVASEFHALMSRDDCQIFDGNTFRSVLQKRMREYYTTRLHIERQRQSFVAVLNSENEVWFCYPVQSGDPLALPNEAIVWNWVDNTLSVTELPNVRDMDEGVIVAPQSDTFDDDSLTFDQDTLRFDQSPYELNRAFLIGVHGANVSLFGEITTDNGIPRECIAERTGLVLVDGGGQSMRRVHTLRSVSPYLQSTRPVDIQIGAQDGPNGGVLWEPYQTFDPRTQDEIRSRATGRYFAWRIRTLDDVQWELTDLEMEYRLRRNR